jgi:hypothetical protein
VADPMIEAYSRHIDLEDAIYNFIRPHSALKVKLRQPAAHGRRWQQRTPAIAAGLTDHIWSLEELLSYCSCHSPNQFPVL